MPFRRFFVLVGGLSGQSLFRNQMQPPGAGVQPKRPRPTKQLSDPLLIAASLKGKRKR